MRPQVPREFTEGTGTGPILSIVAAVVMGALFVLEFKDFMKTTTVTDLVMDPGGADGNEMYIAFKVSMPDLVRARPPQGRRLPLTAAFARRAGVPVREHRGRGHHGHGAAGHPQGHGYEARPGRHG